jgi:hypothetical protein
MPTSIVTFSAFSSNIVRWSCPRRSPATQEGSNEITGCEFQIPQNARRLINV